MGTEPNLFEKFDDFTKAAHTIVVSDLHLTELEPENERFPLWKKYKTKEFFFDTEFFSFLREVDEKLMGQNLEIVLNGDIFDFDSVTALPEKPLYRMSWLEKARGLNPQEEKSKFKMKKILEDHPIWVECMRWCIDQKHRLIFTIGNHDLELHFPGVQELIIQAICDNEEERKLVRFNEWFYISNEDTLIEHGNQYDPYCRADDPINPYVQRTNLVEVKVPFGNLATRYMVNGMGFINPHSELNYMMTATQYVKFFFKYVVRAQPLLIWSWFWGSSMALYKSFINHLRPPVKNPLLIEDKIEFIAKKANTTPRVVRELRELFVPSAISYPSIIVRELWLDRALIWVLFLFLTFEIFFFIDRIYDMSTMWIMLPIVLFTPFFIFYNNSIVSDIVESKEPKEKILTMQSTIARVGRVVFGHTHRPRHEMIGPVEHLNSGTWSPAFMDVECTQPIEANTFVWIYPDPEADGARKAKLMQYLSGEMREAQI